MGDDKCEHHWVPGDLNSDWICDECGARANIPEPDEETSE